jgi:hypothetical protein
MATKSFSQRQKRIARSVSKEVKKNVDFLTGRTWVGVYEDSLYDAPTKGGLWDYEMPPEDISISFRPRANGDSTFTADRVITYDGKDYTETFIGSVSPEGRVILNSMNDSDMLIGEFNRKDKILSLLFYDEGDSDSSFGSQTAVGTVLFTKV